LAADGITVTSSDVISVLGNIVYSALNMGIHGIELIDSSFCCVMNNNMSNWQVHVVVDAACVSCAVGSNLFMHPLGGVPITDAGTLTVIDANLGDVGLYQEGDYGVAWAGVAITGTAANGTRVMLHNTNGGCATPNRWYVYSGGAWHYTVLT